MNCLQTDTLGNMDSLYCGLQPKGKGKLMGTKYF